MSYPRSMQFAVSRLAGYSKNGVKLRAMSQETAKAGDVIVFELPTNTVVDLRTFSILCRGTSGTASSAGNAVRFPKHIETLIESVQVEINGTLIDTGFLRYNQLHKTYMDYFCGVDKANTLRNLMQKGVGIDTDGVDSNIPLCFNTFLGFLSAKCGVIDTSILGQVRVLVRLASNDVLIGKGTHTADYTLASIFATIDVISVNDGIYYDMIQQRLAEAPIEVLFDRYYTFENGVGSGGQATRWAVQTQSLDWVVGTLLTNNRTGSNARAFNATTTTSEYFTRSGSNITDSIYYFNNFQYPNYIPRNDDGSILCKTMKNFNVLPDLIGGGDGNLNSYTNWQNNYWCHVHRFNHLPDAGDDNRLISGLNTLGANAQGVWQTTGGASNVWPLVHVKTTSTLAIGQGRQLEVRT